MDDQTLTTAWERAELAKPLREYLFRNTVRWHDDRAGLQPLAQGHDRIWWVERLKAIERDPLAMGALRLLLARRLPMARTATDEDILLDAAIELERGELCVCERRESTDRLTGPGGQEEAPPPPPPPQAAPRERPAPPPEPDSLSSGAAQGDIAESHRQASLLGIALCEECLKGEAGAGAE